MSQTSSPSIITSFIRWLRLKNYQYEVTISLYMLTPIEKFVFNTLLLLITSMLLAAAYVYLPDHVTTVSKRIWYYWAGDAFTDFPFVNVSTSATAVAAGSAKTSLSAAQQEGYETLMETAKKVAETAATTAGKVAGGEL
ncbi:hypothetical protein BDBG_05264 [Blastomyces gilchristii SLH14081]|uniref:Small subunit of serine palmitoyltransferase-like protein n=1 Tax=Blastomyces gilchristii (strain SLH14081) TaxID=559298 RepID=A0A179USX1_BLAGS|nr:uncharacterized protein BDBG_05264 [Blastomyces gilchristii SLH14081]OAT09502.1 hypothetical protein BDBG_05264 [Blastomyces gilchristii SLH14081]